MSDSLLLYVHPPIAITGYILVLMCFLFLLYERRRQKKWKHTKKGLYLAWLFNLVGITTGMIWAASAWGSYWSWDPKETTTLILFIIVCFSVVFYEKRRDLSFVLLAQSLLVIAINLLITFSSLGLHAHGS
jgi:ABC-type transport system involved in cytochrome c biogenesis permease subunit